MTKLFSAKSYNSPQLLNTIKQTLSMKLIRTPETHNFTGGWVKFSTSRTDGELYFEIILWNKDRTNYNTMDSGKVKDEAHLKELQKMEPVLEK